MTSATRTAETVTIDIRTEPDGHVVTVNGEIVVPGVAITPALNNPGHAATRGDRFALTHVPSGRTMSGAVGSRCRTHIEAAAEIVRGAPGIDWTGDAKTVAAAAKEAGIPEKITAAAGRSCRASCDGEPRPDQVYVVRCSTCDWSSDDDEAEPITCPKEAKRVCREHECEPWIEIKAPGNDRWLFPSQINDDGTIYKPPTATA